MWVGGSLDHRLCEIGKFRKENSMEHGKAENLYIKLKNIYKALENSTKQNESQKIYASMACMSSNAESPRRYFGDSSQLTNFILDSGGTCHMTLEISGFVLGLLLETDIFIEVSDGYFIAA